MKKLREEPDEFSDEEGQARCTVAGLVQPARQPSSASGLSSNRPGFSSAKPVRLSGGNSPEESVGVGLGLTVVGGSD